MGAQIVEDLVGEVNEYELNTLIESGSRLSLISSVPDHGTYTSERYLDTGPTSELPLCLTRRASVTLKPLFQHKSITYPCKPLHLFSYVAVLEFANFCLISRLWS